MVQKADCSHDLASWHESIIGRVTWVTNNDWCLCCFLATSDSGNFAIGIESNLVNALVEHEGTSMDSTESREAFWKTTESIDWIKEWTVTVSSLRIEIQLHFLDGVDCRLKKICVLVLESNCMP